MVGTWALNLFDRLHIGHKVMIDRLSEMTKPVACVTGGELVGPGLELEALIQPIEVRERNLRKYIQEVKLDNLISIKSITEVQDLLTVEGDTTFLMYEGPCCTEIESGALNIRKEKSGVNDIVEYLKPVRAHDGEKISSARIRLGEIDREGHRLVGTKEPPRELKLEGRIGLKAPKGDVFATKDGPPEERVVRKIYEESPKCVISVGDVTSSTLIKAGYTPQVMIVDGITKRGPFKEQFMAERIYDIFNPAAVIYPEAWSVIHTAIQDENKYSLIIVEGEEDLMGFPAVLLAPDGAAVLYGQPDVGIVWIPVNKENKRLARNLLEEMPIIK
jgi:uncharacterized protein (UPF0218 family)/phosphopantetheine adenylyltransferase